MHVIQFFPLCDKNGAFRGLSESFTLTNLKFPPEMRSERKIVKNTLMSVIRTRHHTRLQENGCTVWLEKSRVINTRVEAF